MITLTAEAALDAAAKGRVLLCFAREQDLWLSDRILAFYHDTQSAEIVRVEPTIEAAQVLQVPRYPTFILYDRGSERWQAVGIQQLKDRAEEQIR